MTLRPSACRFGSCPAKIKAAKQTRFLIHCCGRATAKRSRASAGRGRSVRATGLGEGGVMSGEAFEQREHTLAHARLMARPSAPGGRLAAVGEKPVVRPRQGGNIAIAGAPAELALAATD